MAESSQRSIWDSVVELTREAQEKGSDPLLWAMQLSSYLNSAEVCVTLPSIELADVLVSYICWDNNVPILWKFLDKALVLNIVPPILVLALLSTRFAVFCFHFVFDAFKKKLSFLGYSWKWVFVECSFGYVVLFCKVESKETF